MSSSKGATPGAGPYLTISLQLIFEPLKVTVAPPYTGLLQLEDRQVCLWGRKKERRDVVRNIQPVVAACQNHMDRSQ